MGYGRKYNPRTDKLGWTRENWLHRPTRDIVDDSDPRTPRTVDQAKKQHRTWLLIGSQANTPLGYYRRDMNMTTATHTQPTYTATWHPNTGPTQTLTTSNGGDAYYNCVRHHQAQYDT